MANYSLMTAIKDYAIVGELVVKLTAKKPLAYWNAQSGDILLAENAKQVTVFKRRLAAGFIKMLDPKMVKSFNKSFTQKQLMENIVVNCSISELVGYPRYMWGVFLLQWISEPNTGTGFDYVDNTAVSETFANGNIRLLFEATANRLRPNMKLICEAGNGQMAKVADLTPVRIRFSFVSLNTDDPSDYTPTIVYSTMDAILRNANHPFTVTIPSTVPVGSPDTITYILARIEVLAVDVKGKTKSKEGGKFDTLQVVGCRI
jgi:hypothetical protein